MFSRVRDPTDPEYKKIPPEDIYQYRGLTRTQALPIPELAANRECTDVAFIVVFLLYVTVVLTLATLFICLKPVEHEGDVTNTTNSTDSTYKNGEEEVQRKRYSGDFDEYDLRYIKDLLEGQPERSTRSREGYIESSARSIGGQKETSILSREDQPEKITYSTEDHPNSGTHFERTSERSTDFLQNLSDSSIHYIERLPETKLIRDSCGNYCGQDNRLDNDVTLKPGCEYKNLTSMRVLLYKEENGTFVPDECVQFCQSTYKLVGKYECYPAYDGLFQIDSLSNDTSNSPTDNGLNSPRKVTTLLAMIAVTTITVMFVYFFCLYYWTKVTFWTLLILHVMLYLIFGILLLSLLHSTVAYVYAFIYLVAFLIFLAFIVAMRHKINFVIRIYEEAVASILHSPMILIQPIMSIGILVSGCGLAVYGAIKAAEHMHCGFIPPPVYFALLIVYLYWLPPFVDGCQIMIVAGTVSQYYFARDKSGLYTTVCQSRYVLIRYHLGSVALGSFLIALISIIKAILARCARNPAGWLAQCLVGCAGEIVNYLTTKAYIMTAMHGKSLMVSGKRGARLIWHNLLDTLAIDCVSAGIFVSMILLTVAITGVLGYGMAIALKMTGDLKTVFLCLIIGATEVALISYFYIQILSIGVQTLFLCYCEDLQMNDGSHQRPYFMSNELKLLLTNGPHYLPESV